MEELKMDEKKLREEFKRAHDDNIAQLIKEGNYVNYDYAVMSDFETFKKCREVEEEIKEKGLNIIINQTFSHLFSLSLFSLHFPIVTRQMRNPKKRHHFDVNKKRRVQAK